MQIIIKVAIIGLVHIQKLILINHKKNRINKRIDSGIIICSAATCPAIGSVLGPAGADAGELIGVAANLFAWFKK